MRRHLMNAESGAKFKPFAMPQHNDGYLPTPPNKYLGDSMYGVGVRKPLWESNADFFWHDIWGTNPIYLKVEGMIDGDILGFGGGDYSSIQKKYYRDGLYKVEPNDFRGAAYGLKLWNPAHTSDDSLITIKFLIK